MLSFPFQFGLKLTFIFILWFCAEKFIMFLPLFVQALIESHLSDKTNSNKGSQLLDDFF